MRSNPTPLTNAPRLFSISLASIMVKQMTAKRVKIYVADYCPYCRRAEALLTQKGIPFDAMDVTDDEKTRAWLVETTGFKTVPQIFIDGKPIGGFDHLSELDKEGKLDPLTP